MQKVTEDDFEKVRKYIAVMKLPTAPIESIYAAKQQAYEEATPGVLFLIEYHFTRIDPDDGEKSPYFSTRPYGTTKTQRAVMAFKTGIDMHLHFGGDFLNRHPDLLENAIMHYKQAQKRKLDEARSVSLGEMTGEQLLLILAEHESRKKEGYPLMMPPKEENGISTYKNPFATMTDHLAEALEEEKKAPEEAQSVVQGGSPSTIDPAPGGVSNGE